MSNSTHLYVGGVTSDCQQERYTVIDVIYIVITV